MTRHAVQLDGVEAGFLGRPVLHDVSLAADAGEVVAVVGSNGAGKSVLGRTISGLVAVSKGRVLLHDADVTRSSARARVLQGLHHLSQRRGLVPGLSVADNVRVASFGAGRSVDRAAIEAHPVLSRWSSQDAGSLSGGEQALVALARAELLEPRVLVADEPTAGLAAGATDAHAAAIRDLARRGTCVVLIEQNLSFARKVADRVVVLRTGTVALDVPVGAATDAAIAAALAG